MFDDLTQSFSREGVDDNFSEAQLTVTENYAGLYDGDDFYVYQSTNNNFYRQGVDDLYKNAAISGLKNGILFYDGDDIYAYCDGNFSRDGGVDDNAIGYSNRSGIHVDDISFTLDSECRIQRWRP